MSLDSFVEVEAAEFALPRLVSVEGQWPPTEVTPALEPAQHARLNRLAELQSRQARRHRPILVSQAGNRVATYVFYKRIVDVLGSLAALMLLSPVLVTSWLVLLVTTKGRPFYGGPREGLCGRRYQMYKFRTMVLDADKRLHEVQNEHGGAMFKNRSDPRITRVGRFLRAFSIDELPQLFNVLRGDMSLVGPRPMVPAADNVYQPWQLQRLAVKPGITGLWQVSGRSEIGFVDMVRLDIRYARQQNLALDFQILLRTPLVVLSGKGAY